MTPLIWIINVSQRTIPLNPHCAFFIVAIMSLTQGPKSSSFPTTPHHEEHVTETANKHAFKHHHPVLNERQVSHCSEVEATRKQKIEKTQWSSWEDLRPQLCMKAFDLH